MPDLPKDPLLTLPTEAGDQPTPDVEAARLERTMLEIRAQTLAGVRRAGKPSRAPDQESERELTRRVVMECMAALARCEVIIEQGAEPLERYTIELRRANRLVLLELQRQERERSVEGHKRTVEAEAKTRRHNLLEWAVKGAGGASGSILRDPRLVTAVVTAIVSVIATALATWGIGGFERLPVP